MDPKLVAILAILKLAEDLEPAAVQLVTDLLQDMSGQTADAIYSTAAAKFAAIKAEADKESGAAPAVTVS